MPWPAGGGRPVRRLRHRARRLMFAGRPRWQRWTLHAVMTLAWPAGAMLELLRHLPLTLPADRPAGPGGWLRRAGHALALALRDNVPPGEYVACRLHDPARRDRIDACLYWPEIRALTSHLNRLNGAVHADVQDKARFARLCRRYGLACIPTLAVYRDGAQAWPAAPFLPEQPDLWVKDLAGSHGSGAARWKRDGEVYRDAGSGLARRPAELIADWRRRDCIVQPCLESHSALAPLSDGSLVDFRVISGIGRDGEVAIVAALAQLPCDGAAARRYAFAAVGPAGAIGSAVLAGSGPVDRHPDTDAPIPGVAVPFWSEALDLVVRAHRGVPEFSRFVFLGWDVAVTADGPLLIETNSGWGGVNHQLGDGTPLGETPLPAIAMQYLDPPSRRGPPCG